MTKTHKHIISRALFYLLLLVIFVYIVFPFYWALRSSVTPGNELFTTPVAYWPTQPTLAHYQEVFSSPVFLRALLNSTIVAVSVTLLSLVIGVLGSPIVDYADEVGRGENIFLGYRNVVHTPMQWTGDRNAGFSSANWSEESPSSRFRSSTEKSCMLTVS